MTPKEHAKDIYDFQKRTIKYFIKDVKDDDLHFLAKQISLNIVKYAIDRLNDKSDKIDISMVKSQIKKL